MILYLIHRIQSLVRVFLDLVGGLYLLGVYIRRPSLPTVHFHGGVPGFGFYGIVPLFITHWIMNSERFQLNVLHILVF